MTERIGNQDTSEQLDRASAADRTKVIVMAQVVVIVALLVIWSIFRARRSGGRSPAEPAPFES